MNSPVKLAVAAIVAMALGAMLIWGRGIWGTNLTYADVLKAVNQVETIQFKQTLSVPGQSPQIGQVLVSGPSRIRYTDAKSVIIMDVAQGKFLMIPNNARAKIAVVGDWADLPIPPVNLLEKLQSLSIDAKPIGQKEIEGHKADGFESKYEERGMQVWVDALSHLPLLVQRDVAAKGAISPFEAVTWSDFVWNPKVDESLMSITPPEGYYVMPIKGETSAPTAADLTAGLKAVATLNGGRFPANIDAASMDSVMQGMEQRSPNAQAGVKMLLDAMPIIRRMYSFVGNTHYAEDCHYAGEGVSIGQAGRAIFWYHPPGAKDYKVIDADLSVHDVAQGELPKVPSKLVTNPVSRPATKKSAT